jgi:hypothetical protein
MKIKIQSPLVAGSKWKAVSLALGLSLMAILLIGTAPGSAATAGASVSYNDVQLFIQTSTSNFTGTYSVSAYNGTGYAVATYQGQYPAASFELPIGTYLFTVSASNPTQYTCLPVEPVTNTATTGVSQGGTSAGPAQIILPCGNADQDIEYGYAVQQISGPVNINISTQPTSSIPTSDITIDVNYANGTAASGAYLYASPIGASYGWTANGSAFSVQTGTNGVATLVVPSVPVEVTAWSWVPINLPQQPTTVQVNVGGEKVNVTVSWEPSYVGLAGSTLVIPPHSSGSIILHAQQPSYWVMPGGVESSTAVAADTQGTVSNGAGGVPASIYTQASTTAQSSSSEITQPLQTAVNPGLTQTGSSSSPSLFTSTVLLTIVSALALGVSAASLLIVRRRSEGPA